MRTSAFVVPRALAPLVRAATFVPLERFAWLRRGLHLDEAAFARVRDEVVAAAATPRTAQGGLRKVVDLEGRGTGPLMSLLAMHGDVVSVGSGSLTSNASRYQSRRTWLGDESEPPDPDPAEARAWLAGEYLRAFGPARTADFAWWSGMSALAPEAIAAHATVDVGDGLLLLASDEAAFERSRPCAGVVTLLPKWDAWTMGYPLEGRSRFLDRDVHDRVFDGDGNGLGMVIVDGRAAGAAGSTAPQAPRWRSTSTCSTDPVAGWRRRSTTPSRTSRACSATGVPPSAGWAASSPTAPASAARSTDGYGA